MPCNETDGPLPVISGKTELGKYRIHYLFFYYFGKNIGGGGLDRKKDIIWAI